MSKTFGLVSCELVSQVIWQVTKRITPLRVAPVSHYSSWSELQPARGGPAAGTQAECGQKVGGGGRSRVTEEDNGRKIHYVKEVGRMMAQTASSGHAGV